VLRLSREDPRILQLAFLGSLLILGVLVRDFSLQPVQVVLCLCTALGWQLLLGRGQNMASAAITGLGLSLLVRADNLWVHPLCATVALVAKFTLRWQDKAIFNPANLGVVLAMAVLPGAWTSPGQWGHAWIVAGWILMLGLGVTLRVGRVDSALGFLACWLALCSGRIGWLGQNWVVLGHQFTTGSLILFSFFMISDPRTTPDHRAARFMHAATVALVAFTWQYGLYRPHGPIVALALCTPLVPMFDRLLRAARHQWPAPPSPNRGLPDAAQTVPS
jgi:Na+-transporting NADH:ubiquinone oxidoreductase subunit NqrB